MYTLDVCFDGYHLIRPDGAKLVLFLRSDGEWRYVFVHADGSSNRADSSVDFLA